MQAVSKDGGDESIRLQADRTHDDGELSEIESVMAAAQDTIRQSTMVRSLSVLVVNSTSLCF